MKRRYYGWVQRKRNVAFLLGLTLGLITSFLFPYVANNQSTYKTKWACEDVVCEIRLQAERYGVDPKLAYNIAMAESSLNPLAVHKNMNGSVDTGVYQINSIHNVPDSCLLDFRCNIQWAMNEMKERGTGAWLSSKHNW